MDTNDIEETNIAKKQKTKEKLKKAGKIFWVILFNIIFSLIS